MRPLGTGFVVPRALLVDRRYREQRRAIERQFREVELVSLPDGVFNVSQAETALLIARGRPVSPNEIDLRWVGAALYQNGEIEETGLASGVMGHPAMGIAWLANKVGPHGITLQPGHTMLAGSFTRPIWVKKGDTVQADFGPLGNVAVQFV